MTHLFSRLKEQLVFGDKHVSNVNIDFFLSFFNKLQFYYRCQILSKTPSTFAFGVANSYVQGASGTYQLSLMRSC